MHLVVVCSRHDVCWSETRLNSPHKCSGLSIKHRKVMIEPFGLIDHFLIFIGLHIVRIVHAVVLMRAVVR